MKTVLEGIVGKIKGRKFSKIAVLRMFFGIRSDQKKLDFLEEIKALSDSEKLLLAREAAMELNIPKEHLRFRLY